MVKEAVTVDWQKTLLEQCLTTAGAGRVSLDMCEFRRRPEVAARAASTLVKIVRECGEPEGVDLLVPACHEMAALAREVALGRGLWVCEPTIDSETGKLVVPSSARPVCAKPQRIVVIEGVHDDENLAHIMSLPWVAEQTVAVAALLYLGNSCGPESNQPPIHAAIWDPVVTAADPREILIAA